MTMTPDKPLTASILAIMYFGDVVFAISGALTAARYRMDVLGFVLIGTITGIGGGTTRDLLLGRTVWWTQNPFELILCIVASLITFFFITSDITRRKGMIWSDTLGLAVFGVVGCHIALQFGAPFIIAVFMGMVTATGGGVIRDVLTNTQPMIVSGQVYATAALLGSLSYASMRYLGVPEVAAEVIACLAAFSLRASAIIFNIRMGPPGEFIRIGGRTVDAKRDD
ncbi:MAG: trimeric intracellular cation channel family protein [Candidatus Competibacteraceae bacterium]|nr:MAG: trimeric intracellular cation channel family protein [Candidatus Competibacteraceae bacterium]